MKFTRRDLVFGAGAVAATGIAPTWPVMQKTDCSSNASSSRSVMDTVMDRLSTYMTEARSRALPSDVLEKRKSTCWTRLPPWSQATTSLSRMSLLSSSAVMVDRKPLLSLERTCFVVLKLHSQTAYGRTRMKRMTPIPLRIRTLAVPRCPLLWLQQNYSTWTDNTFCVLSPLAMKRGPEYLWPWGGLDFQTKTHRPSHSIANTFGASAAAGCCASPSSQQMRWLLDYAAQQASGVAAWQRGFEHVENAFVFGGMPARTA